MKSLLFAFLASATSAVQLDSDNIAYISQQETDPYPDRPWRDHSTIIPNSYPQPIIIENASDDNGFKKVLKKHKPMGQVSPLSNSNSTKVKGATSSGIAASASLTQISTSNQLDFQMALDSQLSLDDEFSWLTATMTATTDKQANENAHQLLNHKDVQQQGPIIGLLTLPVAEWKKGKGFNHTQYIIALNNNFIKVSGSRSIGIPYDINDQDLHAILDQINGFWFTGGGTKLVQNGETDPYYKTAKKIFEYSQMKKDKYGEDWPVYGVCQGIHMTALLGAEDNGSIISNVSQEGLIRPIHWEVKDPKKDTKMFASMDEKMLNWMTNENFAYSRHQHSVTVDDFNKFPKLKELMKITQTDEQDGTKIVMAMEGKKYPIFMLQYHPEYQLSEAAGPEPYSEVLKNENEIKLMIKMSNLVNSYALKNSNRMKPEYEKVFEGLRPDRVQPSAYTLFAKTQLWAYGYDQRPSTRPSETQLEAAKKGAKQHTGAKRTERKKTEAKIIEQAKIEHAKSK